MLKTALACYENDAQDDQIVTPPVEVIPPVVPAAPKAPKVFSQDDINKFLAEDRRKHAQKFEQLETAYTDALANQNLSKDQREQLEAKLEDLQKTFRSREQQLEHDKKQLEDKYVKEVKELETKAVQWESKYKQTLVDRSLQDAAVVNDAFNTSQIIALLRPMTKIVEKTDDQGRVTGDPQPMVDLTDIDTKTGEPIITRRTPEDAVRRMKELPSLFGNLFKSNIVSGVGAGTATGGNMSGTGRVDPKKISTEQYMRLRKENPESLGLKPR